MEKIHATIVFILSIPLFLYQYALHLFECVQQKNSKLNDKLFMRRFNFIDDQHIRDYIIWSNKYCDDRKTLKEHFINSMKLSEIDAENAVSSGCRSVKEVKQYLGLPIL